MSGWGIFGGITAIIIGFFLTWKAYKVFQITGRIGWAERYFESFGGTFGFYRFLGIIIIIVAFLYMSGACDYVIVNWLGSIFGGYKQ